MRCSDTLLTSASDDLIRTSMETKSVQPALEVAADAATEASEEATAYVELARESSRQYIDSK